MKKVFLLVLTVIALSLVFSVSVSASETDSEISLFEALENDLYIDDIDFEEVYVDDGTNSKITLFSIKSSLSVSFISNSTNKQYINTMINYYLNEHAQLLSTLKAGNPVVMFFEGGSDNVDNSKYNSDNKYRMSAVCIVLKYNFTSNSVYIAYANENCTTMPDHPLAYGSYDNGRGSEYGTATLKDGIYGIYTVNHQGKYASFNVRNNGSGSVPAVYMKSNGGYSELNASGINIHTRTLPYVSGQSNPWSAGCILVGASTPFADYNSFIETTAPSTTTKTTTTYKSNSIYKYSSGTGVSCGMLVMDRYLYRSKMLGIYKNQNAIDCITNFSLQSYINASGTEHSHSYTEFMYYGTNHPHYAYYRCYLCDKIRAKEEFGYNSACEECVKNHTHTPDTYLYQGDSHPHYKYYKCRCGEIIANGTNDSYTFKYYGTNHPHYAYYGCVHCDYIMAKEEFAYNSSCSECVNNHTHTADKYLYYGASHPHYKYYECNCGEKITNGTSATYEFKWYGDSHPHYAYYGCVHCNEIIAKEEFGFLNSCNICVYTPAKPLLKNISSYYETCDDITFNWEATKNTTHYNLYLYKMDSSGGYQYYENIFYAESGCSRSFEPGKYKVVLESKNSNYWNDEGTDWLSSIGDAVYFDVSQHYHAYDTFQYYGINHPHYAYYKCSCGDNIVREEFGVLGNCNICLYTPEKPCFKNLCSSYKTSDNIVFDWDNTENTTHYNIYLRKLTGSSYEYYENIFYAESGLTRTLPQGKYLVYLQSTNSNYWTVDNSTWLHTEGDWIYFSVSEKDAPYTSSTVTKNGNILTIHTELYNLTALYEIIIAGYKDNRFVTMVRVPHDKQNSPYTLEGNIDKIKVMVWSDLSTLEPLCEAEEITSDKFIIE